MSFQRIIDGFICLIVLSSLGGCVSKENEGEYQSGEMEHVKRDKHRPAFHFTPQSNWMNDPNGMVYFEEEYHLFYQYYPDSTVWGPMHWGHAVSKDLISWEHLPIALYPDSLGYIFSGSAVVDWQNTSGFGEDGNPPLIAIFTYHDMEAEKAGRIDFQYQGIAYSLDKGRTWTKYDQNPVLPNQGVKDFRDPKVFWYEPGKKWVMTLAELDHVSFYSSTDLKKWEKESDFGKGFGSHAGVWECPDLFEIQVNGTNESKWVLLLSINPGGPQGGSATQYFVGDFDGQNFIPDESFSKEILNEQAVWLDYGADNYAGVTWSDIPEEDGRRLFIGWMSNWQYAQVVPTTKWRSAMTMTRALELHRTESSYRIHSKVIDEYNEIIGEGSSIENLQADIYMVNLSVSNDFEFTLANVSNEQVVIEMTGDTLYFDRSKSGIVDFEDGFGTRHQTYVGDLKIEKLTVYVDYSSVEIFVNDGELVITELIFPNQPFDKITVDGDAEITITRPIKEIM
ncbi:MAG: glycoside hydrolase family 32 protein [Bacteroidota bacterium]